jgi:glycine oxidase
MRDPAQTADVLILGGGLIGASIALRLAQAKLRVVVLDRGEPGSEASSAAAGMLAPHGETIEPEFFFKLCAASRDLYADFAAEVEELSGERVGYRRDGTLLVAPDVEHGRELEAIAAWQSERGHPFERLTAEEAALQVPGLAPELAAAYFVPGDHVVDNERLMRAVLAAARRLGVTFCAGRPATKLNLRAGRVESVEAAYGADPRALSSLSAGSVILAAGSWSGEFAPSLGMPLPVRPCRGQMLELEAPHPLPFVVRAGMLYMVPRENNRIVVGTTVEYAGFEKAVTAEGLISILEGVRRFAPMIAECRFGRAWSGLRPDTADHLPMLGRGEMENLIFATGHFRNGILLAPVTAQVISELALGQPPSHDLAPYSPARFRGTA